MKNQIIIENYFKESKINFNKNGFVHLKNLLNKDNLTKIKKESLIIKKKKNIKGTKFLHIHKFSPLVKNLFKNIFLKNLLTYILNYKSINGLQSEIFFNPKGTVGYGYHQDDFFLGTGRNNSANLWIPLIKTNKKNGTLYFLNNSHVGKIDKKMNIINLSSNKDDNRFTANYKMTRCDCNLGDAILISNYVFHKSGKNLSNNSRNVLALGYIKQNSKYNAGKTAKRKPFVI